MEEGYEIDSVKYLEIQTEKILTWKQGINQVTVNLIKAKPNRHAISREHSLCVPSALQCLEHLGSI